MAADVLSDLFCSSRKYAIASLVPAGEQNADNKGGAMVEKSSVLSPDERQIALSILERLRTPVFESTARTGCDPCPKMVVRVVI
jgi:hypothetical protein